MSIEDSRLTIWLNFIKFLLGTFAIGIVTILVNLEIQERKISLEEQKHH